MSLAQLMHLPFSAETSREWGLRGFSQQLYRAVTGAAALEIVAKRYVMKLYPNAEREQIALSAFLPHRTKRLS